ncbi:MAG: histidinol-phosphatase HisJ family protein [Coriobacteriia bacterium]|nr:histidinol-phosphatase HisJ family protein [Coriobacteriia bacterium]
MIDLHVHTARCGHAVGSAAEYVAAAASAKVSVIAFTDHLPLPPGYTPGYAMPWVQLPLYVNEVRALADASAGSGGPEVLLGVEADWIPGQESLVRGALDEHEFDMVLGSVHFIDDWAFDDPTLRERYSEWTPDLLWGRYFEDLAAAAATGLYDVMAHPDLVKKFDYRPLVDPKPLFREAAAVFHECGVAVEVNTAGLRKPCAEIYPSLDFLKECRIAGVPATIGSDAHCPEEVGASWPAGRDLLLAAGYSSVVVFRRREPQEIPL